MSLALRTSFLVTLLMVIAMSIPVRADVQGDLAATGIELHRETGNNWTVTLHWTIATWGEPGSFTYTRTLMVRRSGQFLAQPMSESETAEPQDVCNDNPCTQHTCHVRVKGRPAAFEGSCGLVKPKSSSGNGKDKPNESTVCSCNTDRSASLIVELLPGDELVFSLTPSPGFLDDDPSNDSLTVMVE